MTDQVIVDTEIVEQDNSAELVAKQQLAQQQLEQQAAKAQQDQINAHINQQIQNGIVTCNMDVQRIVQQAQALEALVAVTGKLSAYEFTAGQLLAALQSTIKKAEAK